jgi:hypothetical protein
MRRTDLQIPLGLDSNISDNRAKLRLFFLIFFHELTLLLEPCRVNYAVGTQKIVFRIDLGRRIPRARCVMGATSTDFCSEIDVEG